MDFLRGASASFHLGKGGRPLWFPAWPKSPSAASRGAQRHIPSDLPWTLTLRERQSRAFANHQIFSLLLVLANLVSLLFVVGDYRDAAKTDLSSACWSLESAATTVSSFPHYAAASTNELVLSASNVALNRTASLVQGGIQLLHNVLLYLIRRYQRLLLCTMDTVLQATVGTLAQHAEEIRAFLNTQIQAVDQALQSGLSHVNAVITSTVPGDVLALIVQPLGGSIQDPIQLSGVIQALNFTIPETLVQALQNLSSSIPSLDQIEATIEQSFSAPFQTIEDAARDKISQLAISPTLLPVPPLASPVSFCSDLLDLGWIDQVAADLQLLLLVACGVVLFLSLVSIAADVVMESRKYQQEQRQIAAFHSLLLNLDVIPGTRSELACSWSLSQSTELYTIASHPRQSRFLSALFARLERHCSLSQPARARIKWLVRYASHSPSGLCFLTGLLGVASISCQLWLIQAHRPDLVRTVAAGLNQTLSWVEPKIVQVANESLGSYLYDIDTRIQQIESEINGDLFGWVDNTLAILNTTVAGFATGFSEALSAAFAPVPPLRDAVMQFTECLLQINLTVQELNQLQTEARSRLRIDLPLASSMTWALNESSVRDMLLRIQGSSPSLSQLSSLSSSDSLSAGLDLILAKYFDTLCRHRYVFALLMAFGSLVFWLACLRLLLSWAIPVIAIPTPSPRADSQSVVAGPMAKLSLDLSDGSLKDSNRERYHQDPFTPSLISLESCPGSPHPGDRTLNDPAPEAPSTEQTMAATPGRNGLEPQPVPKLPVLESESESESMSVSMPPPLVQRLRARISFRVPLLRCPQIRTQALGWLDRVRDRRLHPSDSRSELRASWHSSIMLLEQPTHSEHRDSDQDSLGSSGETEWP
ncbi:uncharacterized protein BJ171DRAFT_608753 [Polychytrium aggregatum]|uniref:uncharacterized protein n=1 Tax=Polychytrium aggregatum TaxID=110093 RepID=UPI0022FE38D5|nr:uncharacterized protein BJ171DRAFT_608753 [Polychytrium aggregatum]KAI9209587.1 hypothetical protein BJ171DRAFT_608753 [Polychytrium aggregatum]